MNKIILTSITVLAFLITKFLWGTFFVSFILAISIPILYVLAKIQKKRLLVIWWGLFILLIDFILIILLIVPTKSYNINTKNYYKNKQNYAKIFLKDSKNNLKKLKLIIKNNDQIRKSIKFVSYKKEKIILKEWDKLYFICRPKKNCKKYKSFIAIYLWDDSIFRIKPGTIVNLKKITKNLENLANSKTNIELENGNLWFHVVRLIKDSKSMNIETWKWQSLIIRWTAWFIQKDNNTTYAIDYSHFIEVKNKNKSVILKQWQWAEINQDIKVSTMDEILNKIWLDKEIFKEFEKMDTKYIKQTEKQIQEYLQKFWSTDSFIWKLENLKLRIFSIWNSEYKKNLENYINYNYLIWKSKEFTSSLTDSANLSFLASNLQDNKVKIGYLANEVKKSLWKNLDIYKTYIINLKIEWKIKDIDKYIDKQINNTKWLLKQLDNLNY